MNWLARSITHLACDLETSSLLSWAKRTGISVVWKASAPISSGSKYFKYTSLAVRVLSCAGSDCLVQGPVAPGDALSLPARETP